jgi:hypothetical protein
VLNGTLWVLRTGVRLRDALDLGRLLPALEKGFANLPHRPAGTATGPEAYRDDAATAQCDPDGCHLGP